MKNNPQSPQMKVLRTLRTFILLFIPIYLFLTTHYSLFHLHFLQLSTRFYQFLALFTHPFPHIHNIRPHTTPHTHINKQHHPYPSPNHQKPLTPLFPSKKNPFFGNTTPHQLPTYPFILYFALTIYTFYPQPLHFPY